MRLSKFYDGLISLDVKSKKIRKQFSGDILDFRMISFFMNL